MSERRDADQTPSGTPAPVRGSAHPAGDDEPARTDGLDEELLEQAGGVPHVDALDAGDPGAPVESVGTQGTDGTGPGSRYEGGAGGSGARVAALRQHGEDIAEDRGDAPAGGGPAAGRPS